MKEEENAKPISDEWKEEEWEWVSEFEDFLDELELLDDYDEESEDLYEIEEYTK